MLKLFTITDKFQNKTGSRDLFVKTILMNRYYKFEPLGENFAATLLAGNFEIAIQVAVLNISDNKVVLTTMYDKKIKYLIIITFILILTSIFVLLSSNLFNFSINKDFKIILLIHPILAFVMFVGSRIALYVKRNELIDDLKKSKLISELPNLNII